VVEMVKFAFSPRDDDLDDAHDDDDGPVTLSRSPTFSLYRMQKLSSSSKRHQLMAAASEGQDQAVPSEKEKNLGISVVQDVSSMDEVTDHIIIIVPQTAGLLQYFLRPLRSRFLDNTTYNKDVVILGQVSVADVEHYCRALEVGGSASKLPGDARE
jgi:hypothetical protein